MRRSGLAAGIATQHWARTAYLTVAGGVAGVALLGLLAAVTAHLPGTGVAQARPATSATAGPGSRRVVGAEAVDTVTATDRTRDQDRQPQRVRHAGADVAATSGPQVIGTRGAVAVADCRVTSVAPDRDAGRRERTGGGPGAYAGRSPELGTRRRRAAAAGKGAPGPPSPYPKASAQACEARTSVETVTTAQAEAQTRRRHLDA